MKNQTTFALAIIITAFISSCAPPIYIPISEVVPTVEERGDLIVKGEVSFSTPGISLFTNGEQTFGRLSATYGISDRVGAHAEFSKTFSRRDNRKNFSLGIGHLGKTKNSGRLQVYLTAGLGSLDYTADNDFIGNNKSAEFVFAALQPKYSVAGKHVEIYMASNFKNMRYSHIQGTEREEQNTNRFLVEPSAGIVVKLEDVQLHSHFGLSYGSVEDLDGYFMGLGVSKTF